MFEIRKVSRDVYVTKVVDSESIVDGIEYMWDRYGDYQLDHVFENIVVLERVLNKGVELPGNRAEMLYFAVEAAHFVMVRGQGG